MIVKFLLHGHIEYKRGRNINRPYAKLEMCFKVMVDVCCRVSFFKSTSFIYASYS
jgi:hypothetical protein